MAFDPTILADEEVTKWLMSVNVDTLTDANVAQAIVEMRSRVGNRIFVGRQPDRNFKDMTVVVQKLDSHASYTLTGHVDLWETTLQVDVWSRAEQACRLVQVVQNCIHRAVNSFIGYMGQLYVQGVEQDRDQLFSTPPNDGSVLWEHRASADYIFYHRNPTFG